MPWSSPLMVASVSLLFAPAADSDRSGGTSLTEYR
jgi:hypothetical protein